MVFTWIKSQCSTETEPIEIDTTSSKVYVYIRKNFKKVQIHDEFTDTTSEMWEFDEAKLTNDEYSFFMAEKNRSDIDYIMAMSGIE